MSDSKHESITLPAELSSVTVARHFTRDAVAGWGLAELADDVQLCTSELVANAVRHAGTGVRVALRLDTALTVEVHDGQPELHTPFSPRLDVTADHGRGLQIVAAISADWGVVSESGGKCIWFALQLPDEVGADADVLDFRARSGDTPASDESAEEPAEQHAREQARATH